MRRRQKGIRDKWMKIHFRVEVLRQMPELMEATFS